jgi:antitoxin MazE
MLPDEAGLSDEVDIHAEPGRIVIQSVARARAGWSEAARRMAERGDETLLDPPTPTQFDAEEWGW